LSETKYSANYR